MSEKNELENPILRGVDCRLRRINFGLLDEEDGSEISWATVEYTIRAINFLVAQYPKKPIEIHMSSGGGDLYQALRLYDAIQSAPCQIKFFGSGEIMSAATFIMAGCDERNVDPNTAIMIHGVQLTGVDPTSLVDTEIDIEESKRLSRKMLQLLSDNSRMPLEFYEDLSQRDTFLTAEEAQLLGLVDRITEPKKRGSLRKARTHALNQLASQDEMTKLVKSLYKRGGKGKRVTKIEVHLPKEEFDTSLIIDDAPVPVEEDLKNNLNIKEEVNLETRSDGYLL